MKQIVKQVEVKVLNKEVERELNAHFIISYNDINTMRRDEEILKKYFEINETFCNDNECYIEIFGNHVPEELQKQFFKIYSLYDLDDNQKEIDQILELAKQCNSKIENNSIKDSEDQEIEFKVLEFFMKKFDLDKRTAKIIIQSHQTWEEDVIDFLIQHKGENLYDNNEDSDSNTNFKQDIKNWFWTLSQFKRESIMYYADEYKLNDFDVCKVLYNEKNWFDDVVYDYEQLMSDTNGKEVK